MRIGQDKATQISGDLIAGKRVVVFVRSLAEARQLMKEIVTFLNIDLEIKATTNYTRLTIRVRSRDHEGVAFFRNADAVRGLSADSVYLDDTTLYELWFKGFCEQKAEAKGVADDGA